MLPQNKPDRIRILFDDHRLVANAGLLLPATLARHLGLRELVDHHLDLGGAPGRANTGDKMLTLVASALAGGDCIDDADALRAGGTVGVLGCVVKAPSTLGTFLRSFRWGHVRQLDRVSRQLLARAWAAGAGPGDSPLTINLDSTICETYGLAKEGARHHGYTGARGYHPLLAIAAGTGEVLMSRLREGRANTARGAAHFLPETVGRRPHVCGLFCCPDAWVAGGFRRTRYRGCEACRDRRLSSRFQVAHVLVQHTRHERLAGYPFLNRPPLDGLQIIAGDVDVDPPILLESGAGVSPVSFNLGVALRYRTPLVTLVGRKHFPLFSINFTHLHPSWTDRF